MLLGIETKKGNIFKGVKGGKKGDHDGLLGGFRPINEILKKAENRDFFFAGTCAEKYVEGKLLKFFLGVFQMSISTQKKFHRFSSTHIDSRCSTSSKSADCRFAIFCEKTRFQTVFDFFRQKCPKMTPKLCKINFGRFFGVFRHFFLKKESL